MKKSVFLFLFVFFAAPIFATDMMHLLQGGYDAKVLTDHQMDSILNADSDDRYKLECENKQQLFRHSFLADYYLVDKQKNTRIHLGDGLIRDPKISDNGKYVVYAKPDNNLYIYKVDFQTEVAITKDTTAHILNGVADWLYEEEFGITSIVSISPDSKLVAFVRFNEADVPSFEWQTYLEGNYPKSHFLKYPKAGETNPKISVCVYDIHYKSIRTMQLPDMQNSYVPRLCWSVMPAGKADAVPDLMVLQLNRDQNLMQVHKVNAKSTVSHPFYREESKKHYVNFEYFDDWQWLSDGRVIVISEKGGYAQAYLYSPQGIEQRLLTPEKRDIMRVYGWDEMLQTLYFQAAPTPTTRHAYAYSLRKNYTTQLTKGEGMHALTFSKDMTRYIDCYQSNTIPNRYTLYAKGSSRLLLSNDSVASAWKASGLQNKEFFTIRTERGDVLNAWKVLPVGFDQTKKYPVVMMQYSGPSSQRVTDSWRKRFAHYLSAQGYLVVCADGRGTHARGREWRNATYMQLGTNEAEDQISVAKYLRTLPYVDAERIALCGWSYGGYQTIMSMSMQPTEDGKPLWKCGMAIAPVTSWRLYDAAYTERYMRRPQVNEYGYDQTDAMKLADKLQGKLLLVHGLADDNVHAQQSWLYVDALVKAGKQFEMQFYPDDNHFLRNGSNYEHLHNRLLLFLQNNL
jgi:dipeptidyl-peptidase-4